MQPGGTGCSIVASLSLLTGVRGLSIPAIGSLAIYPMKITSIWKAIAVQKINWTPEEDAILGTDSLAKISVRLNRPTSQIQKRMKELGIAHFAQRGTPRSSVRLQAEEAQKERNKIRFIQRMRKGAVIAEGVANGYTYTALAKELGISPTAARNQFFVFLRVAMLPSMLGEEIPRDFKNIPSHVLKKAVCCVENYCLNLEKEEVE